MFKLPQIPRKYRALRILLELLLVLLLYLGLKAYMEKDLAAGMAPPLQGQLLDGRPVDIQALQGKPLLLHFWASWCSVCKLEQSSIDAISRDHQVVSVAMQSGTAAEVAAHMQAQQLQFPVVVDEHGEIARRFGITGVPTSFIIGPDGAIRFSERGYTTEWGLRLRLWYSGL